MSEQITQKTSSKRRAWIWALLVLLFIVAVPAVVCGVCTASVGLAGPMETTGPAFGPAVGLVRVEGTIFTGASTASWSGGAGSETIIELIQRANENPDVRAIVLRIDSPGGDAVASDEIYHALTQVDKPIVVSMGSMAASGGYYIAAPADYIFATPHTLTGSIGVISEFVIAEELLDDIGIDLVVLTAGEVKDFGSPHRQMTEEEIAYWQTLIDEIHEGFIQVVAEGRGMSVEEVRELADGRVVTGRQAVELGLVDAVGYLDDAIAEAAARGGITGDRKSVV